MVVKPVWCTSTTVFSSYIVKSFVEMAKFLLKDSSADLFLSERISQDPFENYFGQQKVRGGHNQNPNLQQCLYSAAAIRVQKSIATDPVHGNCGRKLYADTQLKIDDAPLPETHKGLSFPLRVTCQVLYLCVIKRKAHCHNTIQNNACIVTSV